jgi:hypothetical protein
MAKRAGDPGYAAGWCIHYRGIQDGDSCEKGVPYSTFTGHRTTGQPCFLTETGESKPGALPCAHLRRPTKEEITLHREWLAGRMNRMVTVQVAIAPWREKHAGKSLAEVIACPICSGRLHLSISSHNGHVHGRCETPQCISWME